MTGNCANCRAFSLDEFSTVNGGLQNLLSCCQIALLIYCCLDVVVTDWE